MTINFSKGIHVPCKTAGFLDDSPFLDTGTFKQCAGRAGRRGFDNHANVIFLNVPDVKLKHLISSSCTEIRGNFVLSPTFVLKLLNLNVTQINDEHVLNNSLVLLNETLNNFTCENECEQKENALKIKFYFYFCCKFLYKNWLINKDGLGCGLMNLTCRLNYHEPGNLALNHLISKGTFERLCRNERDKRVLHEKIIIVLSYLFNLVQIYDLEDARSQRRDHSANSKVNFMISK